MLVRYLAFLFTALILAFATSFAYSYFVPKITDEAIIFYKNDIQVKSIPINKIYEVGSSEETRKSTYVFNLTKSKNGNAGIKIVVDDCVEEVRINGEKFDISKFSRNDLCDIHNGTKIDFAKYLKGGKNKVEVDISDQGGAFSLFVEPLADPNIKIDSVILCFWLLPVLVLWQRKFLNKHVRIYGKFSNLFTILFYSASVLFLYRFALVPPIENTHDFHRHMEYIKLLSANFLPVDAKSCYLCYHPAGYYYLAAIVYKFGIYIGMAQPACLIKALGLFIYLGIISAFVLLVKKSGLSAISGLVAFCMFMFWQLGVVKATDINNDMLASVFIMFSLLFTLEFYKSANIKNLYIAMFVAIVGMYVKTSVVTAFVIAGVVVLFLLFEKRLKLKDFFRFEPLSIIAMVFVISSHQVLMVAIDSIETSGAASLILNPFTKESGLWIKNDRFSNYVLFPLKLFILDPFLNTENPATGRDFFWVAFFKTVLSGEWYWRAKTLAMINNSLFLAMTALILIAGLSSIFFERKVYKKPFFIHALMLLLSLALLIWFRIGQPFGCSQDVRYIYSVIPIFCICYAATLEHHFRSGRDKLAIAGGVVGVLFSAISALIIIFQYAERI